MSLSVAQALAAARGLGLDRLDAQLLLARALQRPRAWLLAHDDAELSEAQRQGFEADCARRAAGEPMAYLSGEREFHGLRLGVSPAVLVPRPETEGLVDWALELLAGPLRHLVSPALADLGTGSGAIALALAQACPQAQVTAVDRSAAALAVARRNGQALGLAVQWLEGDWWAPLAGGRFDLVLSNPPYVAEGDPHLAALTHEPRSALTAGADGLDDLRRIVAGAAAQLRPGGWLLLEHGHDQGAAVAELLRRHGWQQVSTRTDLAGLDRCTGGCRPAA